MTVVEMEQLERVHACLGVPLPATGSRSHTTAAVAKYAEDMRIAMPMARDLIRWIATGEPYVGAVRDQLKELEEWFLRRKHEEWR